MCERGHDLLVTRDSLIGRLWWARHASACPACREVRDAERVLHNHISKAGRWPASPVGVAAVLGKLPPARESVRGTPQHLRRAGIACAVCFGLLLLVGGAIQERRASFSAAWAATTEAVSRVRTVHYRGEDQIEGRWSAYDVKIEFPDKRRSEGPDDEITVENGDRELIIMSDYTTLPWHPTPYRYVVRQVSDVERRGRRELAFTAEWLSALARRGALVRKRTVTDSHGRRVTEAEFRVASGPSKLSSTKVWVDPETHLLTGWESESRWKDDAGRDLVWRTKVHFVEYNIDLPDSLFNTESPPGEEVLDYYSQDGMRASLESLLTQAEKESGERRAVLVKEFNDNDALWQVSRLSPKAQKPIRERMEKLGITTRSK